MKLKILLVLFGILWVTACDFGSGGGGTGGEGLSLTGVIVDPDGVPVADAKVRVYPEEYILSKGSQALSTQRDSTLTDSAGRFRFTNLAAGRYNVEASAVIGGAALSVFIPGIYVGENTDLGLDTLRTTGSLRVSVWNAATFAPLSGATCHIVGGSWDAVSDNSGSCLLPSLAPGRYRVLVTYPGLTSVVTENVTVYSGSQASAGVVYLTQPASGTDSTWTLRYEAAEGEGFISMAWSGSQIVAVAWGIDVFGEEYGFILTSPDGISWTKRNPGTTKTLGKIIWGGNQFLIFGDGGVVLASPDGISWTTRNPIDSNSTLNDVVWTGTKFVAVGFGHSWVSSDGITWVDSSNNQYLTEVACNETSCVALDWLSDSVFSSTDGLTWTARDAQTSNDLNGVAWGGGQFVVVGDNGVIRTSTNGILWERRISGSTDWLNSIAWINGRWLINDGRLYSMDGVVWLPGHSAPATPLFSTGARLVGLGYDGIYTSP